MRCKTALLALLACTLLASSAGAAPGLRVARFGQTSARKVQTLLVVLHADEPDRAAEATRFAEDATRAIPGSAAVAVIRPGYADARGRRSPGTRGDGKGDDYTARAIDAVADTVARFRKVYARARVVVVGDRGGAVVAADLAGLHPRLVDGLVLVSCPCALPEWRRHMAGREPNAGWNAPSPSLDPLRTAGGLDPQLKAAILVGSADAVTPVQFSRAYAEALTLRGIDTDYRILPAQGDALLGDPEVLAATRRLAAALPRKP